MSIFSQVAGGRTKRSKFDLSHEKKLSFKMGQLIPTYIDEIVPGDKFRVNSEIMLRFAPMIAPVMHRMNVYTHYFFVPNRLIWEQWESFITGGRDGTELPIPPRLNMDDTRKDSFVKGRLGDYLGLPVIDSTDTITDTTTVSALPFRAYLEIYNNYYRDPNLTVDVPFSKGSGGVPADDYDVLTNIRLRSWEKDYFTSALPWAQRGDESLMPLRQDLTQPQVVYDQDGNPITDYSDGTGLFPSNGDGILRNQSDNTGGTTQATIGINNIGVNINDLRKSVRLQEWLERSARGGHRYIEQILAHFGVRSSDQRLQRPEYLGGGKQPVVISEVLNTTQQETVPQGTMSGHGIAVGGSNQFKRHFEEHGFVIGITSVIPKTAYQQGIHRMWSRQDKFDYYWPEFAQIGEQEVNNQELFYNGTTSEPGTFGYQARYAEYKYGCSTVHGDFRDNLNFWHLGRFFNNPPALNSAFTNATVSDRIFAVQDGTDYLWAQIYNNVSAIRPMPYFNNPTL